MSKGVHLVTKRSAIDADTGMIIRTSKSVLFIIPWDDRWIVGTTDTEWTGDRAEPAATAEDVDYILGEANRVLARPLTREAYSPSTPACARWSPSRRPTPGPATRAPARSRPPSCPVSTWWTRRCPAWSRSPAASSPPTG
jgi:hypothetical protein